MPYYAVLRWDTEPSHAIEGAAVVASLGVADPLVADDLEAALRDVLDSDVDLDVDDSDSDEELAPASTTGNSLSAISETPLSRLRTIPPAPAALAAHSPSLPAWSPTGRHLQPRGRCTELTKSMCALYPSRITEIPLSRAAHHSLHSGGVGSTNSLPSLTLMTRSSLPVAQLWSSSPPTSVKRAVAFTGVPSDPPS